MVDSNQKKNEAISQVEATGNIEEALKKLLKEKPKSVIKPMPLEETVVLSNNEDPACDIIELAEQERVFIPPKKNDEWTTNLKKFGVDLNN